MRKSELPAHRGARYAAISERPIEGIELGTAAVVDSARNWLIKVRNLAIVVGAIAANLGAIEDRSRRRAAACLCIESTSQKQHERRSCPRRPGKGQDRTPEVEEGALPIGGGGASEQITK